MRRWAVIGCLALLYACSDGHVKPPEPTGLSLELATEGAARFEDYIHSLDIYAFRKLADGSFVYYRTLAQLDAAGVGALADGSAEGDTKVFGMDLPVGTYEICLAGNVAGKMSGGLIEGTTTPADVTIAGNEGEQDSVFFLGKTRVAVVTDEGPPLRIVMNRAVSKLVMVLYGVPVQVDSVGLTLGNLASAVNLDGGLSGSGKTVRETYAVRKSVTQQKDTIVGEIITLPSLAGGSPLRLTFYVENGEERVKEMPVQTLLPDKYIRLTGVIDDKPGGLLSFEVKLKLFLVDYRLETTLPDFILTPGDDEI